MDDAIVETRFPDLTSNKIINYSGLKKSAVNKNLDDKRLTKRIAQERSGSNHYG